MALNILFSGLLLLSAGLTLVPSLPAVPLMFLLTVAFAAIGRFETLSGGDLIIFATLALITVVIDYSSGIIGAKFGGASKKALIAGMIGLLLGLVIFPPFGAFIGLFAGVFLAEIAQFQNHLKAFKAASYSLAAVLTGALLNVMIALVFFTVFLVMIF
ncbi:MAG: DUF456 domain-containing protein [Patescibacteria group bacterium]